MKPWVHLQSKKFPHCSSQLSRCSTLPSPAQRTCAVEREEEEEQTGDQVAEEGHHSTGDALGHRVHSLDEELKEDGHTAVDEDAHQDAGGVERGWERQRERERERERERQRDREHRRKNKVKTRKKPPHNPESWICGKHHMQLDRKSVV